MRSPSSVSVVAHRCGERGSPKEGIMNWITEYLAVGDWSDVSNQATMERSGVGLVVNVAAEMYPPPFMSHCQVVKYGISDGQYPVDRSWFNDLVAHTNRELARGIKVMLMCAAGASRSVIACAAVLMDGKQHAMSVDDALQIIAAKRPNANPHPNLIKALREYVRSQEAETPTDVGRVP